jgi:hypothetical protein
LFRSFLASIGALTKRLLAERAKAYFFPLLVREALQQGTLFFNIRFGQPDTSVRGQEGDQSDFLVHSTFWRSARTFVLRAM